MSSVTSLSRLAFFMVNKYEFKYSNTCDFSSCPRPHTCMGLILDGEGIFAFGSEKVRVVLGDIIYVPVTSRYISTWSGSPDIKYISMHFTFEGSGIYSKERRYPVQKITLPGFDRLKHDFEYTLLHCDGTKPEQLKVLSIFNGLLYEILPQLKYTKAKHVDGRIEKAMEYIDKNCEYDISIPQLAEMCNMSVSHFYACFKNAAGVTPIEYKHRTCVSRAIRLLANDTDKPIEEISSELGFYSSTYFRRVFKKHTGKSPNEYRKTSIEL